MRLPDPSVSHRHASIRQRGTDYVILDEGSTNGTYVGATRLEPAAPRVLSSGDLVRVGRVWLEVKIEQAMPTANAQDATKEIALALVSEALAAQGENVAAKVTVVEGPDQGRELDVVEFERRYVVGRGGDVDLTLDDEDASRRHAEIFRKGDHLWVRDLGSKNGTTLGGVTLKADVETVWGQAEPLAIGADTLRYTDPVAEALDELERAADERVAAGEAIDPPRGVQAPEPPPSASSEAAPADDSPKPEARRGAPVAEVPVKKIPKAAPRRSAPRSPRVGWGATDYLVALLALAVLALSLVGMWWLFKS